MAMAVAVTLMVGWCGHGVGMVWAKHYTMFTVSIFRIFFLLLFSILPLSPCSRWQQHRKWKKVPIPFSFSCHCVSNWWHQILKSNLQTGNRQFLIGKAYIHTSQRANHVPEGPAVSASGFRHKEKSILPDAHQAPFYAWAPRIRIVHVVR